MKPAIQGFLIAGEPRHHSSLPVNITSSTSFTYGPALPAQLSSIALSGEFEGNSFEAYLIAGSERYKIADSSQLQPAQSAKDIDWLRFPVVQGEKTISLLLGIVSEIPASGYLDGIQSREGAVGFSVAPSEFSWDINASNLCTRWETLAENSTIVCYGSEKCCNFVELAPMPDKSWNDTFFSFLGQYGSEGNTTIKAQVLYVDYDLTPGALRQDVVYSNWGELRERFVQSIGTFDSCIDTCDLDLNQGNYTLEVIVDGSVTIDNISYTTRENSAPVLIGPVPLMHAAVNSTLAINLGDYFRDPEGDELEFLANDTRISVEGSLAGFVANIPGMYYISVIATDGNRTAQGDILILVASQNQPPICSIPGLNALAGVKYSVNLSEYCSDADNDNLTFSALQPAGLSLITEGSMLTVVPYTRGQSNATILVSDGMHLAHASFEVTVQPAEETMQLAAEVGKPVKWVRTVRLERPGSLNVTLPEQAAKVIVKDKKGGEAVDPAKIKRRGSISSTGQPVDFVGNASEYIIEYETEAPTAEEQVINSKKKLVTISSQTHYTNIKASSAIDEVNAGSVHLYWLVNDSRIDVTGSAALTDTNNNGLIDHIRWTVPHLSNQTYEISITVLNVYTFVRDNETWTVAFNTTGTADLVINSTNARWTEFLNDEPSTIDEMRLLNISCGDADLTSSLKLIDAEGTSFNYNELQTTDQIQIKHLLLQNYSCNQTGTISNFMHKAGYAALMFSFGGQEAFAYDAGPTMQSANITSSQYPIYANSSLQGYCNGSDADNDNLSYYYFWYRNGILFYNGSDSPDGLCFQESANKSTTCGGLSTGSYSSATDYWPWNATQPDYYAWDEDYTTFARQSVSTCDGRANYIYATYSVPSGARNNSKLQIKLGASLVNYSLGQKNCWGGSQVVIGTTLITCPTNRAFDINCGGSFASGFTDDKDLYYEEGIFWNISREAHVPGNSNIHNLTAILSKGQNWTFGCIAYDGTANSSSVNSTQVTIQNTPPRITTENTFSNATTGHWFTIYANSTDTDGTADITTTNISITNGTCINMLNTSSGNIFGSKWNCTGNPMQSTTVIIGFLDGSGELAQSTASTNTYPNQDPAVWANITSNQYPVLENSTLQGWCNATDSDGDNLTFNYRWFNGSALSSAGGEPVGTNHSPGSLVNLENKTTAFAASQVWKFECLGYDGGSNTSRINSSAISIGNEPPELSTDLVFSNLSINHYFSVYANFTDPNGAGDIVSTNIYTTLGLCMNILNTSSGNVFGSKWNCSVSGQALRQAYVNITVTDRGDAVATSSNLTNTFPNNQPSVPSTLLPVNGNTSGRSFNISCSGSTDSDSVDVLTYEIYADSTSVPTTLKQNTTATTYNLTYAASGLFYYRCRVHDASNASSYTTTKYQYVDFKPTNFSVLSNNGSDVTTGMSVNWTAMISDDMSLSHYRLETNDSGSWTNETLQTDALYQTTAKVASLSKTITATGGKYICGKLWANDSMNNANESVQSCFTVQNSVPSITANITSNQYPVYKNGTLQGNCAGSDADNQNLTYYYAWYRNGTLYYNSSDNLGGMCYQESANKSTTCGVASGGSYSTSGLIFNISHPASNAWDEDYNTAAMPNYTYCGYGGHVYSTYSKPSNALNSSVLRYKIGDTFANFSLGPGTCWSNSATVTIDVTLSQCGGASSLYDVHCGSIYTLGSGCMLYEEGIFWNLSRVTHVPGNSNIHNLTATLAKGHNWTFECLAYDGTVNSSKANSTQVTIQNTPPSIPGSLTPNSGNSTIISFVIDCSGSTDLDSDTITYEIYADTSATPTTLKQNTTTTTYNLTLAAGGVYYYRCRAHDGTNASDFAVTKYQYVDFKPANFSVLNNNGSTASSGMVVNWTATISDDMSLSHYRLQTNDSGSWTNETLQTDALFQSTAKAASLSKTITASAGKYVCGKLWANDSMNNANESAQSCFTVQANMPLITGQNNFTNWTSGHGFTVYANATDFDGAGDIRLANASSTSGTCINILNTSSGNVFGSLWNCSGTALQSATLILGFQDAAGYLAQTTASANAYPNQNPAPWANVTSNQYPVLINSTLLGWCNATDADTDNVSYSYKWFVNSMLNASGTAGLAGSATGFCYQETANSSTAGDGYCTLNYGGTYQCVYGWVVMPCINAYDGNWSSYALGEADDGGSLFVNYSMPQSALNGSLLQVKAGDPGSYYNVSLPSGCLVNPVRLWISDTGYSSTNIFCYNYSSTNYVSLVSTNNRFYEEGMWWNISGSSGPSYNPGVLTNVNNITSGLAVGQNWTLECTAFDGYTNTSRANSSAISIVGNIPVLSTDLVFTNLSINHYFSVYANFTDLDGAGDIKATAIYTTIGSCVNILNTSSGNVFGSKWNCTVSGQALRQTYISISVTDNGGSTATTSNLTNTYPNSQPTAPGTFTPNIANITLSSFIITCSGSVDSDTIDALTYEIYADSSSTPTTLKQNTTATTYNLTSVASGVFYYRCRAHDASNASSYTATKYLYVDFKPANFSVINNNGSTASVGMVVNWSATISDDMSLSHYRLETNDSGSWTNETLQTDALYQTTAKATSIIKTITAARGKYVCGKLWANDSMNNANESAQSCFTVQSAIPTVTTQNTFENASAGHYFTVFANVTDTDGASDITLTNISTTSGTCTNILNTSSGNIFGSKWNCTGTALQSAAIIIGFWDTSNLAQSTASTNAYPNQAASVALANISSSQYPVLTNSTLLGWCNATDADGENLTYSYRWFMNNILNTTGTAGSGGGGSATLCYQEHANATTACGGLGTGAYVSNFSTSNIWDGDWTTTESFTDSRYLMINYSKPTGALNSSYWQVEDGGGMPPPPCVREDTLISTPTGYTQIRYLNSGDQLYSMDLKTGILELDTVTAVWEGNISQAGNKMFVITAGGKSVHATGNHLFILFSGGHVRADDLRVGDLLINSATSSVPIDDIQSYDSNESVWDLDVRKNSNFFADDLLVHNAETISNLTIPSSCWSQNPLQFRVRKADTTKNGYWECRNSTNWTILRSVTWAIFTLGAYEEAMWWNISGSSSSSYNPGVLVNVNNITSGLAAGQSWRIECTANDSYLAGSPLNSSQVAISSGFSISTENTFENGTAGHWFTVYANVTNSTGMVNATNISTSSGTCANYLNTSSGSNFGSKWNCTGTAVQSASIVIGFQDSAGNLAQTTETANTYPDQAPSVAFVNITSSQYPIVPNSTLLSWCNATDADGDNMSYYYRWFTNASVNSSGTPSGGITYTWCYQESANASTVCGGLGTGNYSPGGLHADEDWGTGVGFGTLYINYTKPANSINTSQWMVKDGYGTANVTILASCWNQTPLQFRIYIANGGTIFTWSCWSGTTWTTIRGASEGGSAFEEAMWWNLSTAVRSTFSTGLLTNLNNVSSGLSAGQNWTIECKANDSFSASLALNSSQVTIAAPNAAPTISTENVFTNATMGHSFTVYANATDTNGASDIILTNISTTNGTCSNILNTSSGNVFGSLWNCTGTALQPATIILGFRDSTNLLAQSTASTNSYPNQAAAVALVNITSNQYPVFYNSTLLGWCNATDSDADNITYSYKWFRNSTINTSGTSGSFGGATAILCYQESANVSTDCGGLVGGRYAAGEFSTWLGLAYFSDGIWDGNKTDVGASGTSYLLVNYSLPTFAVNGSYWQIKDACLGTQNYTVPGSCMSSSKLQFRYGENGADSNEWLDCYNGTAWNTIYLGSSCGFGLYEEAMWWNISGSAGSTYSPGVLTNVNNKTGGFAAGQSWTLECSGNDSFSASPPLNSSQVTISNSPPAMQTDLVIANLSINHYFQVYANFTDPEGATDITATNAHVTLGTCTNILNTSSGNIFGSKWNCTVSGQALRQTYINITVTDSTGNRATTSNLTNTYPNNQPTSPSTLNPTSANTTISSFIITCSGSADTDTIDTLTYEIYADTTNAPTTLKQNTTATAYNLTNTASGVFYYRCRAHDASNASTYAATKYQYVDFKPANFSTLNNNGSAAAKGMTVNWTATITDDMSLSHYRLETNDSGSWTNETLQTDALYQTAAKVASISYILTAAKGKYVCGKLWANDTLNNANESSQSCFTVQNAAPIVSTENTFSNASSGHSFIVYANVTDIDGASDITLTNVSSSSGSCINMLNTSGSNVFGSKWNCSGAALQLTTVVIGFRDASSSPAQSTASTNTYPNQAAAVVLANITSNQYPVLDNSTLLGWCNATDADADNLTYSYRWFMNSTLNASGTAGSVGSSPTLCYQESANVSPGCGGLSTGSYYVAYASLNNGIDGNWSTAGSAGSGTEYIYVNYTIPSSSAAGWQIKAQALNDGNNVRADCYNYSKSDYSLVYSFTGGVLVTVNVSIPSACLQSGKFIGKITVGAPEGAAQIYEEAMWWNISGSSGSSYNPGVLANVNNITSGLSAGQNWTLECMGNDSFSASSPINSSQVTISAPNAAPTISTENVFTNATMGHSFTVYANATDANGASDISLTNISTTNGTCSNILNTSSGNVFGSLWNCTGTALQATTIVIGFRDSSILVQTTASINTHPNQLPSISNLILNSTTGLNNTQENLTAYYTTTDTDIEATTNITDWRRNGTSIAILNMPFDTNISGIVTGAIRDYSTFGHNGTLGEGTLVNSPTWTRTGKMGGAYEFDGINDYMTLTGLDNFSGNNITVSFWAKSNNHRDFTGFVDSSLNGGGGGVRFFLGYYHSTVPYFVIWIGNGVTEEYKSSGYTIPLNVWEHYTVTVNGSEIRLFVNGTQYGGTMTTSLIEAAGLWKVGNSFSGAGYFNGSMDELKIYNRSLSLSQIYAEYQAGLANHSVQTIASSELTLGDNWTVSVWPNDRYQDGTPSVSYWLRILNYAPTISTQNAFTNGTVGHWFTVSANATDTDTASDIILTNISTTNGTCTNILNTSSDNIFGSKWNCTGTALTVTSIILGFQDTAGNLIQTTSSTNTYPNQVPAISNLVINSTTGLNNTNENLTAYFTTSDTDIEATTNITDWRKNGTSIAVLNMPFDTEVTSTAAGAIRDYSTFANNGTRSNARWVPGKLGGGYFFNASLGTEAVYVQPSGTYPAFNTTITAWIKPDNPSTNYAGIVSTCSGDWYFMLFTKNTLILSYLNGSGAQKTVTGGAISNGFWYFVAVKTLGNGNQVNITFFVNDTITRLSRTDGYTTTPRTMYIGSMNNACGVGTTVLNGTIDEVHIYNRTLSDSQVLSDYQAGLASHSIQTITSNELTRGDNWTVSVTPNDRYQDGASSVSSGLRILNYPPTLSTDLVITNLSINHYFTVYANFTDSDGAGDITTATAHTTLGTCTNILNTTQGNVFGTKWNCTVSGQALRQAYINITVTDSSGNRATTSNLTNTYPNNQPTAPSTLNPANGNITVSSFIIACSGSTDTDTIDTLTYEIYADTSTTPTTLKQNTTTTTYNLTNSASGVYYYRCRVHDASNASSYTSTKYQYVDFKPVNFSSLGNNGSTAAVGMTVNWTGVITDDMSLGRYALENNDTGTWHNETLQTDALGQTAAKVASLSITITASKGKYVCGKFWANDTLNSANESSLSCFTVQNAAPIVSTENTFSNASSGHSFIVYANVTDIDGASDITLTNVSSSSGSCINMLNTSSSNVFGSKWNCSGTALQSTTIIIGFRDSASSLVQSTASTNTYPNQAAAVVLANITSNQYPVLDNSTLLGWCNATDADADNLTYSYRWFMNSTLNASGTAGSVGSSPTLCYQESANVSPGCGGLVTGSYGCDETWYGGFPCSNATDGDWATSAIGSSTSNVYINYTKPALALASSLWFVKEGSSIFGNYTVPSGCWVQSPLQFRETSDDMTGESYGHCWNSSAWQEIWHDGGNNALYEEAMWWNISGSSGSSYSPGVLTNVNNVSSGLVVGQNWTLECIASDSYSNSTALNSSTVNITASNIAPTWSFMQDNSTASTPNYNGTIRLNVNLSDDTALSAYIFSWNYTGVWQNYSAVLISGTTANISINKTTNVTGKPTIGWQVFFNDSNNNRNQTNISTFTVKNTAPEAINLGYPGAGEHITNRTPNFNWTASYDPDSDSVTYNWTLTRLPIDGQTAIPCIDINRSVGNISGANYTSDEIQCLYDNNWQYNWTVTPYDGAEYGPASTQRVVYLDSYASIILLNGTVEFGLMLPLDAVNTAENDPYPFAIENHGNINLTLNVSATDIWTEPAGSIPSRYVQFQAGNFTAKPASFNWAVSVTTWTNFTSPLTGGIVAIQSLDWHDTADSAELDVRITVPAGESAGDKTSNVTFEAWSQ